ncbi:MAG: long-chain-acyl-CoA synthetase [Brevundimonas sp.]|uniref:long-chain-acyl-CoA synthetase n=1 Tax=Brevundimonas sp. TaxID=1871086 RepID=UPI002734E6F5|nr:long-chain-acyl-CoA synthetase [Brevundimonas sp.]MDP3404132.1 long-chain-acyl-CoA synthetase [Brevundimonas sp.]
MSGLWTALGREIRFLTGGLRTLSRVSRFKPGSRANVADDLEAAVDRHPSRTAILFEDERWTYGDLEQRANRYAAWARAEGIAPGSTVALFMENRPDYLAVWFGMAKVGVATALINTQLTGAGLAHCIDTAGAAHVIVDAPLAEAWRSARPHLKTPARAWLSGGGADDIAALDPVLERSSPARPDRGVRSGQRADDLALLIFTSGTTGLPKAARITHLRMLLTMHSFAAATGATARDVIYAPLPLYHTVGGVCAPGIALTVGGAIALRRQFSVTAFWSDCVRFEATLFQYIGELCRYLVNAPVHPDERRHRLRLAVGNGLRPDVWDRFQARFGVPRILEFYGATESNLTLFNFDGGPHAIGRAPPYMKASVNVELIRFDPVAERPVRAASGRCIACADDEIGEAIARIDPAKAQMRFEGYSDAGATETKVLRDVFAPGDAWFRSGDLMRRDRLGYFYFIDRIGDTFRWKGENVSTTEVAGVLASAPGVLEANVYGVEIPGCSGRAGMAGLVVDEACFDAEAVRRLVHDALPPYARPLFLRLTPAMETTGTFKQKKTDAVREGFDPRTVRDPLMFDDPRTGTYVPVCEARYAEIVSGAVRL